MEKEQFSKEYHMVFLNEIINHSRGFPFFVLLNHTWNNFTSANSDEYFNRMKFCDLHIALHFYYSLHTYITLISPRIYKSSCIANFFEKEKN